MVAEYGSVGNIGPGEGESGRSVEDKVGRACGTNMGRRWPRVGYWWERQRERDHYEDKDVSWWLILRWTF
jgi:hypothetical protein